MTKTYINNFSTSIFQKLFLIIVFLIIIFLSINDYSFLSFLFSFLFTFLSFKIHLKYKKRIKSVNICDNEIIFFDTNNKSIYTQNIQKLQFEEYENGLIKVIQNKNVYYYLDLGKYKNDFKNDLSEYFIKNKKKESLIEIILDILYIIN